MPLDPSTQQQSTVYPDVVRRPVSPPWMSTFEAVPLAIERGSKLASATFPDAVMRPAIAAGNQMAPSPVPLAIVRNVNMAAVMFPDAVPRPFISAADQFAMHAFVVVERATPIADASYPPRIMWPFVGATVHSASFWFAPYPERAKQLAAPVYPDVLTRPYMMTRTNGSYVGVIIDRAVPIAVTVYPDGVTRPGPGATAHMAMVGFVSQPERTKQLATAVFQDIMPRSTVGTPLREVGTAVTNVSFWMAPYPERTKQLATAVFADLVMRPSLPAADQLATNVIPPAPEERLQIAAAVYADMAWRPTLPASETQAYAGLILERPRPIASVSWPDRVIRPMLPTSDYTLASALAPYPERAAPLAASVYPDAVLRPSLAAAQQLAAARVPPYQDRQLIAVGVYPDRLLTASPWLGHQAIVAPPLDRPRPLAAASFPDAVLRPFLATAAQLATQTIQARPEQAKQLASAVYADRVEMPRFDAWRQAAAAWLGPRPEQIGPNAFSAVFPDAVLRPLMLADNQRATLDLEPMPNLVTMLQAWYPDAATRPYMMASVQIAFAYYPFPIVGRQVTPACAIAVVDGYATIITIEDLDSNATRVPYPTPTLP